MRRIVFGLLAMLALVASAAAQGTLTPWPKPQFLDSNGNPVSGGKLCVYLAGTTTPTTTWSDVTLSVANSNPIVLNSAGRPTSGAIYLASTTSYKYVLLTAGTDGTCSTGTTVWTQDNISPVPVNHADEDVTGTAGENLTAGQAVYLSDGSGGKTAGRWYRADSTNTYSSTLPEIGMVPSSITSGATGTIRLGGSVTGLSSLTVGTKYYVSTTGTLTSTTPSNSRLVGVADSTTSLILKDIPTAPAVDTSIVRGRLTLTTSVPVTTADVTAATTLRFTAIGGGQITLYDGANWNIRTFTELSIAVPATTNTGYDVWVFDNAGTPTLELLAWTNLTTRATALTTQDGVLVKTGATTRRYVGSFRTTGVSGQTEDSVLKRFVWNYYNRVPRLLQRYTTDATWNYTTATVHQANANTANQVEIFVGVLESPIQLSLIGVDADNSTNQIDVSAGIGEDSTTTYTVGMFWQTVGNARGTGANATTLVKIPASVGHHFYSWNEWSTATGTTAWRGAYASAGSTIASGLTGWIEG